MVGVYGVGWITALSAGLLVMVVTSGRVRRRVSAAGLVMLWLAGWALNQYQWTEAAGEPLTATLVQGNIAQDLK